jgi:2-hydroxychromene-2-carboxylate isomerase
MKVDLYFSFRSPYSYLILPRIVELRDKHGVDVNFKQVYPLAIREPEFFKGKNLFTYFLIRRIDYVRQAKKNNMVFVKPNPDPINQNLLTGKISDHQPYIFKLTHYCQAIQKDKQLDFAVVVSNKIWSGLKNWNTDESIADATSKVGLNFEDIEKRRIENEQALIDEIKLNQKEQLEAGHHGVPLSVYKDKFFFGQDRFDDLVSELKKDGLVIS